VSTHQARDWDDLAGLDPFWAVLGEPTRDDGFDTSAFYQSGEAELADVLRVAASLGSQHGFERALDVGCGPGRVLRAMSSRFEECVGVDISERMIAEAIKLNADRPNCVFRLDTGPELSLEGRSFDFVYSRLVLQHLPDRLAVLASVRELLRVVRPGGLVVFQVPTRLPLRTRLQPRRRLWTAGRALGVPPSVLFRTFRLHPVRLVAVPDAAIRAAVGAGRGIVLLAQADDDAAPPAISLRYFAELA
jgi:SAM-dependent methyltransferase